MDRDHTDQLLTDLAEARRKKKRRHDSTKTPPGSPPHQPPPPPPLVGLSGTSISFGAFRSSQLPPPPSNNQSDQSKSTAAPSSSKTVHSSDDEDIRSDHIPKVNLKQDWWKPLPEEDRPATPELTWSIPSSDLPVPINKWASALVSTYAPPPENSLLAQTGDMANIYGLSTNGERMRTNITDKVGDAIIRYNVSKTTTTGWSTRSDEKRPIILGCWRASLAYGTGSVVDDEECVVCHIVAMYGISTGGSQQTTLYICSLALYSIYYEGDRKAWKDVDRSKEFMFAIQKWLKTRRIFCNLECFIGERSYAFLLVVLPEHPSDTKVLTMKMEILLEPSSNKLLVEKYEYAGLMVTLTRTPEGITHKTRMIKRFTVDDDLKESLNITQV
ncbi:hypothetical protein Tco_0394759 [Tanacetum coccineum]